MTEAEWLASDDLRPMLRFRGGEAGSRKLRLFACACCRRIWRLMHDRRACRAVELSEAFADGQAKLKEAQAEARNALRDTPDDFLHVGHLTARAAQAVTSHVPRRTAYDAAYNALSAVLHTPERSNYSWERERVAQPALLRDILGNPFHPVSFDTTWQSPEVVSLAQAAYDQRTLPSGELDAARLAVIADALEDAGCTDPAILDHLRGPGPHVRGCWPLDLILGKS
jgi:hypothetical protein